MVHQYKLNGANIVVDGSSGAVHLVDDLAYEVIAMASSEPEAVIVEKLLSKYGNDPAVSRGEIEELLADIRTLKERGKLFSEDVFGDIVPPGEHVVKALCLHVAHTCNLTCDYCFASGGRYQGERALMPFEVGRQALDFLIESSGSRRNLEVDFFGGEPLLNWDVVKRLVVYARSQEALREKKFRFTFTTNGILLDDEVIGFLNREMDNVVLSLDGRPHIHDRMRRTPSGKGSYDIILPKFKKLVERRNGKDYYIRGTFTHGNIDFSEDILHMADLGFTRLSMEPVVCPPGDPYALTEDDLPEILRQYERLAVEMQKRREQGRGFVFYHYMVDLARGPCIHKRVTGCGAGSEYLAVTPHGELYPCHQFVGEPEYAMGDIWKGVTNTRLRREMASCSVYSREDCRKCWAKLYCGGGCYANACHATGSVCGTYAYGCEMFRKRMECAILLNANETV